MKFQGCIFTNPLIYQGKTVKKVLCMAVTSLKRGVNEIPGCIFINPLIEENR